MKQLLKKEFFISWRGWQSESHSHWRRMNASGKPVTACNNKVCSNKQTLCRHDETLMQQTETLAKHRSPGQQEQSTPQRLWVYSVYKVYTVYFRADHLLKHTMPLCIGLDDEKGMCEAKNLLFFFGPWLTLHTEKSRGRCCYFQLISDLQIKALYVTDGTLRTYLFIPSPHVHGYFLKQCFFLFTQVLS